MLIGHVSIWTKQHMAKSTMLPLCAWHKNLRDKSQVGLQNVKN